MGKTSADKTTKETGKGLRFQRYFTKDKVNVYDLIQRN